MNTQTLNFSILINAPKEKVWEKMLSDESYRKWTSVFNPTSHFVGDWSAGSKMLFVGSDEKTGKEGGMVSRIAENRMHEYMSIEHLGLLNDGVEELWSEEKNGFENYTFLDKDGGTELKIEMTNVPTEWADMFTGMWPASLQALKNICEK